MLKTEIVIVSSGTFTLKQNFIIFFSLVSEIASWIGRYIPIKTEIAIGSSGNFKQKERSSSVA